MVVFPIVFFLTFVAAIDQQPVLLTAFVQHKGWPIAHIILIFTGYAALCSASAPACSTFCKSAA